MVLLSLLLLILIQQLFWMMTCHRLVNKLMSRSYFEYQQATQAFIPKPIQVKEQDPDEDMSAMDGVGQF